MKYEIHADGVKEVEEESSEGKGDFFQNSASLGDSLHRTYKNTPVEENKPDPGYKKVCSKIMRIFGKKR